MLNGACRHRYRILHTRSDIKSCGGLRFDVGGKGGFVEVKSIIFRVCVFDFIFLAELSEKRAIMVALKVKYIKLFATIIYKIQI